MDPIRRLHSNDYLDKIQKVSNNLDFILLVIEL